MKKSIKIEEIEIRKYQETDNSVLLDLLKESVRQIDEKDYSNKEKEAWINGINEERFYSAIKNHDTYVALFDSKIIGFADMANDGYLDHLYVDPSFQKLGVATSLCDVLESQYQGIELSVHASICAKPFFEKRGYQVIKKQEVERLGVLVTNYVMEKQQLKTKRLILRGWKESDAPTLYKYAKNPNVGPITGWPVHKSVEDSLNIIKNVLSVSNTYAVVLKDTMEAIGSIGLMIGTQSNLALSQEEGEIGYWIGEPHWGNGYIPEAVQKVMQYGFEVLHLNKIWCGYYDGNIKSKRVQEKCGFTHVKDMEYYNKLLDQTFLLHVQCITYEEWKKY